MKTNREIVEKYLENGLIRTCIDCQFKRMGEPWKDQYKEDFFQDIVLVLMTYPGEKLNDVESKGWMNGFLTRVILNQIYSKTSKFYSTYLKYNQYGKKQVDLDDVIGKEYAEDEKES